jgi:hypothetical protein
LAGNPTTPPGAFFDAFTKERGLWNCFTISTFDTPNLEGLSFEQLLRLDVASRNYAPADPIFTYMNIDSRGFPLWETSQHTIQIAQPFQFPGKGLLQGDQSRRAADIARLAYQATLRDVRAVNRAC